MAGRGVLQLMAGHAISVVMAGLFGFFTILAARGLLHLTFGARRFRRISSTVQSSLVVCSVTALLLAPSVSNTLVRDWVAGAISAPWPVRPALWYLGVNETLAGHVVAGTPVVLPPRWSFAAFPRQLDDASRAVYRALLPRLTMLARRGWLSIPAVACLAIATFLWNHRRLPEHATAPPRESRLRANVRRMAEWLTGGDPETRAGFFFTWQTLTRSRPHRTVIAIGVAAGLTHLLMVLATSGLHRLDLPAMRLGIFAVNTILLAALVAGFRYAVTVPPELASNWTIRMAWFGDERAYLAGVKGAALVALVGVPLLVLLPLHVAAFGLTNAVVHSIYGFLAATAALDGLFLGYRQFPFACSYVPIEDPKLLWPAGLVTVLLVSYGFADAERWALQTATRATGLGAALGAFVLLVRLVDRASRRRRLGVNFDERPASPTLRLGLFERVTND
jgi:hypothetical protein